MSFHELVGDYPWLTKRVAEITAVGQGATAEHPRRNPFAWILAAFVPRFGAAGSASLIITIAMIGILAAIAIPAYQDYVVRSQVTEGLSLAETFKSAVESSGAETVDDVAALSTESLPVPTELPTATYVESITVQSGAVVVVYGRSAHQALVGQQLVITPAIHEDGGLQWICGPASTPPGATPVIDGYEQYTSIDPKYLPAACREGGTEP
jgi:Tfp pilus assembly major pilin PilA